MTDSIQTKATRITANDLETVARQGLARALAARQGMTELTAEQVEQVSGGYIPVLTTKFVPFTTVRPPLINGQWGPEITQVVLTQQQFKSF